MAIREEFTLIDRFTSVFNRFINLGKAAEEQAESTGNSTANAMDRATDSVASLQERTAAYLQYMEALEAQGYSTADATDIARGTYLELGDAIIEAAEATQNASTEAELLTARTLELAEASQEAANEIIGELETIEEFERAIRQNENQIARTNAKLTEAVTKYQAVADAHGVASEEAEAQRVAVENLTRQLDTLIDTNDELVRGLEELGDQDPGGTFDEAGEAANRAANGGLNNFLRTLRRVIGAYVSIRAAIGLVSNALNENTYQLRFEATFGEEYGEAAMDFVREQANAIGRTTEQVAQATQQFTRATTNPQNLERLNELADMFSRFSDGNDFNQTANALNQALRTGRTRELSAATGISVGALEQFGVADAAKAGDVSGFIDALTQAADAVGVTADAYENLLNGAQAQFEKFTNTIRNKASQAAGAFFDAFAPVFEELNVWLQSDEANLFFEALAVGFEFVGQVAMVFVQALTAVANFIASNFTTIITIAAIALSVFAAFMIASAVATLAANAPLLLFLAGITALVLALQGLGITAEDIFGFIGGLIGGLYVTAYNIVAALWNVIATFAEFFANVFNAPVDSIIRLLAGLFDSVLSILESAANAIDFIFGSNLASGLSSFRENVRNWTEEVTGDANVQIKRLDELDFADTVNNFADAGRELGQKVDQLDLALLGQDNGNDLSGVDFGDFLGSDSLVPVNVKKNSDKISLADEDLRLLVDLASRDYVAEVNVTTVAPNINVKTENNGDPITAGDIADSIKIILDEEIATHSAKTYG